MLTIIHIIIIITIRMNKNRLARFPKYDVHQNLKSTPSDEYLITIKDLGKKFIHCGMIS